MLEAGGYVGTELNLMCVNIAFLMIGLELTTNYTHILHRPKYKYV